MNIPFKHTAPDETTKQWAADLVKKAMTNEQALGRALELLMQVRNIDSWCGLEFALITPSWEDVVSDIDKFLDDEFRREG